MDKLVGRALFIVWPIDHVTWLGVPKRTFEAVPNPTPSTPSSTSTGSSTSPTSIPKVTSTAKG